MLESEIKKLTVAVEALTKATLERAGTATVTPTAPVAAAPAAAPAAAVDTSIQIPADAPVAETTAAPPADKKQIVEGIMALAKAKGRESAAALLASYGATKVPELKDPSVYGEIVVKINNLLAS